MTKATSVQFTAGAFIRVAESWHSAVVAAATSDHAGLHLSRLEFARTESYGRANETLDVWKHPTAGWFVDYWDTDDHVLSVFIHDPTDFLDFQARYVAPIATKILAAEPTWAARDSEAA